MFDGDEMNIHLAQSTQARNELNRIANVKYQIIGSKDSNPIIGCKLDAIAGAYLLSVDKSIPYDIAANLLCCTSSSIKNQLEKGKSISGKELFSYIIPEGINSVKVERNFQIKNGKLIEGTLDKSQLATKKNSIIHYIWDKYGPTHTQKFIDDTQRLVINYLYNKGLTVGFNDCIVQANMVDQINEIIHTKILAVNHMITQFENDKDKITPDMGEGIIGSELNATSSNIGKMIFEVLDKHNPFNIMIALSGSKGSTVNYAQITGCLGQGLLEGQRIKKKISGRTLPIFHQNDDTPKARGFISSNFLDGLKGHEFFFHSMAGREGLIDTAIKSVTGDTPIIVMENNITKRVMIGDWIDSYLDNNKDKVEHYKERDMELLRLKEPIFIPTSDYEGNVTWGEITAITRHDPGDQLYEIITHGGRQVIVTESKSLLIWNENTKLFEMMSTPDVKVGNYVPVTMKLPSSINSSSGTHLLNSENIYSYIQYNSYYINHECVLKNNDKIDNDIIIMLLNEKGIYCRIDNNNIVINKQPIRTVNDVVLDRIVTINLINKEVMKIKYPKVYDLTVPSTLNFGLANGLHVVDTAESGYISRKLIKSLEDMYVNYEGMIRTAHGVLVQYLFGDSGIDQQRQTELKLNLINYSDAQIKEKFIFSDDEMKKLKTSYDNKEMFNKMKTMRDNLRSIYFRSTSNYKVIGDSFMLPVNLRRITQEYINAIDKPNYKEIDPQYIIDKIEEILNNYEDRLVTVMKKDSILLKRDDMAFKTFFAISLYEYISPKKCIVEYKITREMFDRMIDDIKLAFSKAMVEPGEMVGIVAAQSIGEPTSQMSTLFTSQIKLIVKNKKSNVISHKSICIGKICDEIIKNNPKLTYATGHIDSVETDLSSLDNEYYIIGVDKLEKTHWNKISHVSRHPVNGMLMTVTTKSGREVTTTLSHSHLVRLNQSVEPITGSELKVGMRIPVAKHLDNTFINSTIEIDNEEYVLDNLFGWFIGAYLAEGNISKNSICITNIAQHFIDNTRAFAKKFNCIAKDIHYQGEYGPGVTTKFNHKELAQFIINECGTGSFVKRVPDFAFTAPNEFKAGLIQGYFDGDGNIQCDESRKQIRVCSRSEQLIKDISLLVCYFDIFGSIKKNQVKGSPIYNLSIPAKYAPLYQKHIGSTLHQDKLTSMVEYATRKDAHNLSDEIDKINGLGHIIAKCGSVLQLEGQSRTYGRWIKKDSIGRRTLSKYIEIFESDKNANRISNEIAILKQAVESNVIWDEIVSINIYTPDQTDYVYDFTVPMNQTFMIDSGIIIHNTLNTKHHAGVAGKGSASMGVPRIKELLSYSKSIKTPQMTIYFDDKYAKNKSDANIISSYLKHLTIGELINTAEILHTIDGNDDMSKLLRDDKASNPFYINNMKDKIDTMPFVIRLKVNLEKLMDKETTLLDIKTKFITYWYKNFSNLKNVRKGLKDILVNVEKLAILSNNDDIIHIRFKMSEFDYKSLTSFLSIVLNTITLKGIDSIENIALLQDRKIHFNETGETVVNKEHMVITSGINIHGLLYIKGIDHLRTKINDVDIVYRMYGIEAARKIIIDELLTTFNAGGSDSLNHAHVAVLVDMMTYSGEVISIDRFGLNKVDNDPLSRASFEKTMEHFINAALFSETDKLKSISSRIAIGRVIPGGTGAFDIILDTEKLKNSEYIENETGGRTNFIFLDKELMFDDLIKNGYNDHNLFIPK